MRWINKYLLLKRKIKKNTAKLNLPSIKYISKKVINTDSWHNIKEYKYSIKKIYNISCAKDKSKKIIKCQKIQIYPNKLQKNLLIHWMNCYITMYNRTISLFKKRRVRQKKIKTNWMSIRTNYLIHFKRKLIKNSQINTYKYNTKIYSHVLDSAIQQACSAYKTCLQNLKKKHIKHFRLRYLKYSKPTKILKIEKGNIKNNTFCNKVFSKNFKLENDFQLKNVKKDFTIHYSSRDNKFYLLNPIEEQIIPTDKKDTISLDPGIRTFMTGYTNSKYIDICTNLSNKIKKNLKKIDNVKNKSKRVKKKVERHYYRKIRNQIDDMHWKVIDYLTKNYGNILIGNMSTKSIISNKNYLNKIIKRIASYMRLYVFKQRLKFKCQTKKIGYMEVDEAYSSKTCTNCGNVNNKLGENKTYSCKKCKITLDRDVNGARNIMLLAMK